MVASQIDPPPQVRWVMPEHSRAHLKAVLPTIQEAMEQAKVEWRDITAIAVTRGPGLAGSLLVGVNAAKAISLAQRIPLVGINHMEGHIYSNWILADGDTPSHRFPLPS